ncbi:Uncharacterised protein [Mycobacteroides abscessus]|uniref:Protease n=3 Tax=Mycobacteroides abscessus TaxID=36809 RepID=A0A1U1MT37_9MYCO|nr:hypothetical protein MASS_2746 [Mycobacteroides abscessus subsp. bolletii 50594]EIU13198.1 hypothetical protein MA5S0422_2669 [Mycobacteroides abscessus 5S-0422]EIU20042.1 hypothetical protein MA5S0708_4755 [Mycobacteroides abscessus 5S-0708]EIU30834.1 hypothetical protein MA5S1212_4683 [Mycobacteroides abscessus 5S-1212]EIU62374.1 hypothetical protein MM1S1510930_2705 [Mycobacteroides abscessus subsp. bolletii 1S-151-0930]EIV19876.1 hypothetical protein MM2B0912S_2619 [Mycobacteroides absc
MKNVSRALACGVSAVAAVAGVLVASPALSIADPAAETAPKIVAFPGMSIVQGDSRCTLGYVDPISRIGLTAGHCNATGSIVDLAGNRLGEVLLMSRNLPTGGAIGPGDVVSDYEGISFGPGVELSSNLPNGLALRMAQNAGPEPGLPVCLMGSVSGETCGKVEAINNGWFTMTDVGGQHGDSGGPVYTVTQPGQALLVGIYSLRWGGKPAAMSWSAISAQMQSQLVAQMPAAGPGNGGPELPAPPTPAAVPAAS